MTLQIGNVKIDAFYIPLHHIKCCIFLHFILLFLKTILLFCHIGKIIIIPDKNPITPNNASFIFFLLSFSSGNIPPQANNKNNPLKKANGRQKMLPCIFKKFHRNTANVKAPQCNKA